MRKIILLTCLLLLLGFTMNVHAQSEISQVDIGYYDVWLRSDGETWLNGISPGSPVTHTPTITSNVADISKIIGVKSVEFYPNDEIGEDYYDFAVNNGAITDFEYLGNGQVSFSLNTVLVDNSGLGGLSQKKWWQSQLVQGKRFYLPVKIVWEVESVQSTLYERHLLIDSTIGVVGELATKKATLLNAGDQILAKHKTSSEFSDSEMLAHCEAPAGQESAVLEHLKKAIPSGVVMATSTTDQFNANLNQKQGERGEVIEFKATYDGGGEIENVLVIFCYEIDAAATGEGYVTLESNATPNPTELANGVGETNLQIKATVHNLRDGETVEYWIVRYKRKDSSTWNEERIDTSSTTIAKTYQDMITEDTSYDISVSAKTNSDNTINSFKFTPK